MSTVEDTEKKVEKGVRPQNRHLKPIKKGEVRNPNGRGKGRRDVKTVIWDAMQKIAESQNMTAEEIETLLQQTGLKHALKGNHQFYQSINDRLYGKVKDKVEMDVTTREEPSEAVKELAARLVKQQKQ